MFTVHCCYSLDIPGQCPTIEYCSIYFTIFYLLIANNTCLDSYNLYFWIQLSISNTQFIGLKHQL